MATPQLASLDLADAFVHVANEHRWLSASGCTWNLVGPKGETQFKLEADNLLPNVVVAALDSVLLHARALIDFYTNKGASDDIKLKRFSLKIDPVVARALVGFKRPIELHVLHLTYWRDTPYRQTHSEGTSTQRPDWDMDTSKLLDLLHSAAKSASEKSGTWQTPFKELYKASMRRYLDKTFEWPSHLGDQISRYLASLNL